MTAAGTGPGAGPSGRSGSEVWASAPWRQLAGSWLDEQLAAAGIRRTGDIEQPHLRPWATLLMAPTSQGPVWLKASGPGTAFEVGLYELLARAVPDRVLIPIATDPARGWVLLPDGGPPLGERVAGTELIDVLAAIMTRYAQLQRDFAPEVRSALGLGVADMRPARMPERFDEALEAIGRRQSRPGVSDDAAALRRVAGIRDTYGSWCERLADMPGSASLDHNDLHTWNMLVATPAQADQVRFYDWGDAVVAHPFSSMLVALGWVQRQVNVGLDDPAVHRVRDAYLRVFSDLAPHRELVEALELACHVGKVARALTWERAVREADSEDLDDWYARAPLLCLHSLLDDSYLGGA